MRLFTGWHSGRAGTSIALTIAALILALAAAVPAGAAPTEGLTEEPKAAPVEATEAAPAEVAEPEPVEAPAPVPAPVEAEAPAPVEAPEPAAVPEPEAPVPSVEDVNVENTAEAVTKTVASKVSDAAGAVDPISAVESLPAASTVKDIEDEAVRSSAGNVEKAGSAISDLTAPVTHAVPAPASLPGPDTATALDSLFAETTSGLGPLSSVTAHPADLHPNRLFPAISGGGRGGEVATEIAVPQEAGSLAGHLVAIAVISVTPNQAGDAAATPGTSAAPYGSIFAAMPLDGGAAPGAADDGAPKSFPPDRQPPPARAPGIGSASGGTSFVPLAALLALLALAAPAGLRRRWPAPDCRAPAEFVCALERPG